MVHDHPIDHLSQSPDEYHHVQADDSKEYIDRQQENCSPNQTVQNTANTHYPLNAHPEEYHHHHTYAPIASVIRNDDSKDTKERNQFIDLLEAALEPHKGVQRTVMHQWKQLTVKNRAIYVGHNVSMSKATTHFEDHSMLKTIRKWRQITNSQAISFFH